MATKEIFLDGDKVREFVRGNIPFAELAEHPEDPRKNIYTVKGDSYRVCFDDIRSAIGHFIETNADYDTVFEDWFDNLYWILGDAIGILQMIGETDAEEVDDADPSNWGVYFFKDEAELANWTICEFYDTAADEDNWKMEHTREILTEIMDVIQNYDVNKTQPKEKWIFTHSQKWGFIRTYSSVKTQSTLDAAGIVLYKQILEELAAEGDIDAIADLGYAHYGDRNPYFECNWEIARDCMLKVLAERKDDRGISAANRLGYIYYYGRCNDGVPQYEEAYKYFSYAALGGHQEAIYKVGDLLRDGHGIMKNEGLAFDLYQQVYEDNYEYYLRGTDCVLANAALRIADCLYHGIGVDQDLEAAYHYYLIAKNAIDERIKDFDEYGLDKVAADIQKGLVEVKAKLGDGVHEKVAYVNIEDAIKGTLMGERVSELAVEIFPEESGYKVSLKRLSGKRHDDGPNILVCIDEISYCKRTNEISFFVPKEQMKKLYTPEGKFIMDELRVTSDSILFYYDRRLLFSTTKDPWQIPAAA